MLPTMSVTRYQSTQRQNPHAQDFNPHGTLSNIVTDSNSTADLTPEITFFKDNVNTYSYPITGLGRPSGH